LQSFAKRVLPDWLLIILVSKAAATLFLLNIGYG
jgi:hypothetical protein